MNDTKTTTKTTKRRNNVESNIIDAYCDNEIKTNENRDKIRVLLHALSTCDDMRASKKIRRALRALNHRHAMQIVVDAHFARTTLNASNVKTNA